MKFTHSRKGFTLTELLVVMGIATALGAILFPVFNSVRASSRTSTCLHNLQQIGLAARLYCEEQGGPPMAALPDSLCSYVRDAAAFVCPNDRGAEDSYSAFFVGRYGDLGTHEFTVGCPRHRGAIRNAGVWGQVECQMDPAGPILHEQKKEDAQPVIPGDDVEGGTLRFDDGSEIELDKDTTAVVLTSAYREGILHTVVWLPPGDKKSKFEATVTPGSVFEVITPTAIAAVRGTEFTVEIKKNKIDGEYRRCTEIEVDEGSVLVQARLFRGQKLLKAGDSITVTSYELWGSAGGSAGPWPPS